MSGLDALVVGGGPAGAVAALTLARAGSRVRIIERAAFPRFHVGESFLPVSLDQLRRLGLEDELRALPHTVKRGVEFAFAHQVAEPTCHIRFADALHPGPSEAFNTPRAEFDAMLLDAARAAGAEVVSGEVRGVDTLAPGDCALRVRTPSGDTVERARWCLDASGQASVVGRHLGLRRVEPELKKMAFFQHFHDVERLPADRAGDPTIVMCEEGWFWAIPLDGSRTSIGMVVDRDLPKRAGVAPEALLRWGLERCPLLRRRMDRARGPATCNVLADFSYRCDPCAGPGWFLIGDAAAFLDPIFSTGVSLATAGAERAAQLIVAVDHGRLDQARAERDYRSAMDACSRPLLDLVRRFYGHPFRELLVNGSGPLGVHRAVIALVAGHVFPRPRFGVRWRMRLLDRFAALQARRELVPRQPVFSLLAADPVALPAPTPAPAPEAV